MAVRRTVYADSADPLADGGIGGTTTADTRNVHVAGHRCRVVRTFVDITFAAGGGSPATVVGRLSQVRDLSFLKGPHDAVFHWETPEEYWHHVAAIHQALRGTGATYRLETLDDQGVVPVVSSWVGDLPTAEEENPTIDRDQDKPKPSTERIP